MSQSNVNTRCRRKVLVLTSGLILTLVTGLLGFAFDIVDFGARQPDIYNPERGALVEAQWQLSQALPPASPEDKAKEARQRIRNVKQSLKKAQREHPDDRSRIEYIRQLVDRLQAADAAARQQAAFRDDLYQTILKNLDQLIASPNHTSEPGEQHG